VVALITTAHHGGTTDSGDGAQPLPPLRVLIMTKQGPAFAVRAVHFALLFTSDPGEMVAYKEIVDVLLMSQSGEERKYLETKTTEVG
jgi:hypothetical protein